MPDSKPNPSDEDLRRLLTSAKTIAVVGLSPDPGRASYGVARYLIQNNYQVLGIRPGPEKEILGSQVIADLSERKDPLDIIDVFRKSEAVDALVDEIEAWISKTGFRPKALWLQEGVTNPPAEERARKLGLLVIADRCILKEHARLIG